VQDLDKVDTLPLPGVSQGTGEWSWLLPYIPAGSEGAAADPSSSSSSTVAYRELSVSQASVVPQFESAPYRAVNGYYRYNPNYGSSKSSA
jgi:hypothetical protein